MNIKKLFIAFVFSFVVVSASAQKPVGTLTLYPRVGMTLSKFTGDKVFFTSSSIMDGRADAKYKAGIVAGAELQYQMSNAVALSGGVFYSQQGTKFDDVPELDEKLKMEHNNIIVPLMFVATTKYGLSAKVGVQPEILVDSKYKDLMNGFNFSVPVGISYEYRNICFDVRYNIGLTHIYKDQGANDTSRNSTFMFTLGYGIDI
ncbi:MAG: PorT family protein [Prevotella sp.]|nr:PorT family protein [Prevotella sp.]